MILELMPSRAETYHVFLKTIACYCITLLQVEILKQLKHPNIIQFHGVVSDPRGMGNFIVTGWCLCSVSLQKLRKL